MKLKYQQMRDILERNQQLAIYNSNVLCGAAYLYWLVFRCLHVIHEGGNPPYYLYMLFFSRKLSISLKREETNEGQRNNYMFQYLSFVVSYQTDFIKYIKCHYVIKLLTLVLCQKLLNIVPQTRHTLFS